MAVQVLSDGKFKKEYEVTISAKEIQKEKEAWILANANDMRVDGFRPGKAPMPVLMKNYGDKAHEKAVNKLLKSNHDAIIADHKLGGAELKNVDQIKQTSEEESYKISFSIPPEFDLIDPQTLKVDNLQFKLPNDDIEIMLLNLQFDRGERTEHTDKKHAAKDGDIVFFNLEIHEKDKLVIENKSGAMRVTLGIPSSNPCLALVQKDVVGHKIGDTVTIDEVELKDVQGYFHVVNDKTVKFSVEITSIVSVKKAEPDEKFFEDYGVKTLDELKALISKQARHAHAGEIETCHKRYIFDALDKAYTFELPAEETEEEFKRVWNQFLEEKKDFEAKSKIHPDMDGKTEGAVEKEYKKVAERRIRLAYILAKLRGTEKIELVGEDIPNYVRKHIGSPESEDAQIWFNHMKTNENFRQTYLEMMLEEKVAQWLHSKAKHKNVEVTPADLSKRLSSIMPE